MIRDRRDADLDRLCAALVEVDGHAAVLAGRSPREWLLAADTELAWVFDQAPVSVAPTRNVVGHVLVRRPPDAPWVQDVADRLQRPVDDLQVVGRLFVKPVKHAYGIARFLLTQAVREVESSGRVAVLDPGDVALVPQGLCERLGFRAAEDASGALVRPS